MSGWRSIGSVAAEVIADLEFRRKVERLYARGPRPIAELLAELGAERSIATIIETKLDRHLDVDDAALDATGGREFPPLPLHEVGQ